MELELNQSVQRWAYLLDNFTGERLCLVHVKREKNLYLHKSLCCVIINDAVSLLKATEGVKNALDCEQHVLKAIMLVYMKDI